MPYQSGGTIFGDIMSTLVAQGKVSEAALDAAVANVLKLKQRVGLLADFVTDSPREAKPANRGALPAATVSFCHQLASSRSRSSIPPRLIPTLALQIAQHKAISLSAAQQGVVLVQNRANTLPLALNGGTVAGAGGGTGRAEAPTCAALRS